MSYIERILIAILLVLLAILLWPVKARSQEIRTLEFRPSDGPVATLAEPYKGGPVETLLCGSLPPSPPGVTRPTFTTRAANTFAGVQMAVVIPPSTPPNLVTLVVKPELALIFRTNVALCTIKCATNGFNWVAERKLTNAIAGRTTAIGCPWPKLPPGANFKITIP